MEGQGLGEPQLSADCLESATDRFGLQVRMDDIAAFDPLLEIRDQGFVDPDRPGFLAFAQNVDLAEVELYVLRLQPAELAAAEAGVNQGPYDKFEVTVEPVFEICEGLEDLIDLGRVETAGDPVPGLAEEFHLPGRVLPDPALVDRAVQVFPKGFEILVDRRRRDRVLPLGPERVDRVRGDLVNGDLLEILLENVPFVEVGFMGMIAR